MPEMTSTKPPPFERPPRFPPEEPKPNGRFRFTGWHMLAIMVAFFGVVIGVNVWMARLASQTFTGEVVQNGYVGSQNFNRWLDEAAREKGLGWSAEVARQADGRLAVTVTGKGPASGSLAGASLNGEVLRPLAEGEAKAEPVAFRAVKTDAAGASFVSAQPLAPGRWRLRLILSAGGHTWHSVEMVR